MSRHIFSSTIVGIEGHPVVVEVDVSRGLPQFTIVGLPDATVQESRERIRAAIRNSGFAFPNARVTVNLAPADLKKEGAYFDLPIALALIEETLGEGTLSSLSEHDCVIGELALNGELRPVRGMLSIALSARERGMKRLIIPESNISEATLVKELEFVGAKTLKDLVAYLSGDKDSNVTVEVGKGISNISLKEDPILHDADFAYIRGQEHVKRALEIAAAGAHNIFMMGPPGGGKTMLARALATILPPLSENEVLEVTRLYSVAGFGKGNLVRERPFRQPHHNASVPALVGGGNSVRPGEITLAHRGVLFLDELGEFPRSVLESLRQPLEEGKITVARASGSVTFPARFTFVVAQNPCPCGFFRDPTKKCTCTIGQVQKYHKKISGPLLDRIDMHLEVPAVSIEKLSKHELAEPSSSVRKRVEDARERQRERLEPLGLMTNAELTVPYIRDYVKLSEKAEELLKDAAERLKLSARGYFRTIKLAQTIADLASSPIIDTAHIAEAIQYRPQNFLAL